MSEGAFKFILNKNMVPKDTQVSIKATIQSSDFLSKISHPESFEVLEKSQKKVVVSRDSEVDPDETIQFSFRTSTMD